MTVKLFYSRAKNFKKRYYNRAKYYLFLNTKSKIQSKNLLISNYGNSEIDIITIAFNNPLMIEYQINLMRKNVTDKFTHIIADNSNDSSVRKSIFGICNRLGVHYVSIPVHNYLRNDSHAVAMHWIYKNVIRKRKNKYFGFLDHDIFPIKPCSIIKKLKNNIYGRVIAPDYRPVGKTVTNKQPYWSLWAGFCFLKSDLLYDRNVYKISFFVRNTENGQLDTGGGLWDTVFKKISFPGELAKYSKVKFRDSDDSNIHTDYYECLDDEWIHTVNLSNSYPTPNFQEKIDYFENWLKGIIHQ